MDPTTSHEYCTAAMKETSLREVGTRKVSNLLIPLLLAGSSSHGNIIFSPASNDNQGLHWRKNLRFLFWCKFGNWDAKRKGAISSMTVSLRPIWFQGPILKMSTAKPVDKVIYHRLSQKLQDCLQQMHQYLICDKPAATIKSILTQVRLVLKTYILALTHCGLGDFNEILDEYSSRILQCLMAEIPTVKLPREECHKNLLAHRWMWLDLTDEKSTLVQVMAWCRQATSHYLSQCWPSFLSPYDVTRP